MKTDKIFIIENQHFILKENLNGFHPITFVFKHHAKNTPKTRQKLDNGVINLYLCHDV